MREVFGDKVVETERLILRKYSMMDAEDMFANWVTDRKAARFGSGSLMKTLR